MITFKKHDKETGLRAIGGRPRSSYIKLDGKEVGDVVPLGGGWCGPVEGWYFVLHGGPLPYVNTCNSPEESEAAAKTAAKAFILARLKEQS